MKELLMRLHTDRDPLRSDMDAEQQFGRACDALGSDRVVRPKAARARAACGACRELLRVQ